MTDDKKDKILIANYGMGNLGSIANMIRKIGGEAEICDAPERIASAEKLILPGVGAFDHGMRSLKKAGMQDALCEAALKRGVPVLGVCLGMQLMLESSEEGHEFGLGWIGGRAKRFPTGGDHPRVPHMGWNSVRSVRDAPLLPLNLDKQRFYFVHSYMVECEEQSDILGISHYGQDFCSAFGRGNIFGVQFHPEKSHAYGMALFKRFLEL